MGAFIVLGFITLIGGFYLITERNESIQRQGLEPGPPAVFQEEEAVKRRIVSSEEALEQIRNRDNLFEIQVEEEMLDLSDTLWSTLKLDGLRAKDLILDRIRAKSLGFFMSEFRSVTIHEAEIERLESTYAQIGTLSIWRSDIETLDLSTTRIEGMMMLGETKIRRLNLAFAQKPIFIRISPELIEKVRIAAPTVPLEVVEAVGDRDEEDEMEPTIQEGPL